GERQVDRFDAGLLRARRDREEEGETETEQEKAGEPGGPDPRGREIAPNDKHHRSLFEVGSGLTSISRGGGSFDQPDQFASSTEKPAGASRKAIELGCAERAELPSGGGKT